MSKKWKIGCHTLLGFGFDLDQQMKMIHDMGFKYCDLADTSDGSTMLMTGHHTATISLDGNPFDIKRLAEKHDLTITSLCVHGNLIAPPAPWRMGTSQTIKAIKFAHDLGCLPVITTDGRKPEGYIEEDALRMLKANLSEPLRVAEDYGVLILFEPHGPLTTNARGLKKILEVCDSENVGINFDTGNVYVAGNDPVEVLLSVVDYVHHFHFKDVPKDFERGKATGIGLGVQLGTGAVDFRKIVEIMAKRGFDGPAIMEVEAVPEKLIASRKYIESLVS